MGGPSQPRQPKFKAGDTVIVTGPGHYRDKEGVVTGVIKPTAGDNVHRYRVRFSDRTSATFFGFELGGKK
jgi:hypothetical protein